MQSKFEYDHYRIHPFSKVKIDILHIIPEYDRRLECENRCIIDFKTAYPFGLNDRVNNISVSSKKDDLCIYQNFFSNNSITTPRAERVRSKNRHNEHIDFDGFVDEINTESLNKKDLVKYVKCKILGLSKSKVKYLIKNIHTYKFDCKLVKDLMIDLSKFKIGCNKIENVSKFDSYLVLNFAHKFIDLLNIPELLHDQQLIDTFPVKYTYPKVSFRYSRTLGSHVYNYSQFCKTIKAEEIDEYP